MVVSAGKLAGLRPDAGFQYASRSTGSPPFCESGGPRKTPGRQNQLGSIRGPIPQSEIGFATVASKVSDEPPKQASRAAGSRLTIAPSPVGGLAHPLGAAPFDGTTWPDGDAVGPNELLAGLGVVAAWTLPKGTAGTLDEPAPAHPVATSTDPTADASRTA